jgi:hypothetical protein
MWLLRCFFKHQQNKPEENLSSPFDLFFHFISFLAVHPWLGFCALAWVGLSRTVVFYFILFYCLSSQKLATPPGLTANESCSDGLFFGSANDAPVDQ